MDYLGNVITFYFDGDDALGQDGLKKIREWYGLKKKRRKRSQATQEKSNSSKISSEKSYLF
ncbi:MAG: hypothetical protein QNJ58_21280 [Desulfobacterales bacterium]|nr:hypothetical protein [Desulfobacterales bacterium]